MMYEVAEKKGFKLAFAECTGAISTHIAINHSKMSNQYHQTFFSIQHAPFFVRYFFDYGVEEIDGQDCKFLNALLSCL